MPAGHPLRIVRRYDLSDYYEAGAYIEYALASYGDVIAYRESLNACTTDAEAVTAMQDYCRRHWVASSFESSSRDEVERLPGQLLIELTRLISGGGLTPKASSSEAAPAEQPQNDASTTATPSSTA